MWQPLPGKAQLQEGLQPDPQWYEAEQGAMLRWSTPFFEDMRDPWRSYSSLRPGKYSHQVCKAAPVVQTACIRHELICSNYTAFQLVC